MQPTKFEIIEIDLTEKHIWPGLTKYTGRFNIHCLLCVDGSILRFSASFATLVDEKAVELGIFSAHTDVNNWISTNVKEI